MVRNSDHSNSKPSAGHEDTLASGGELATDDTLSSGVGIDDTVPPGGITGLAHDVSSSELVAAEKAISEFVSSIEVVESGDLDELPTVDPAHYTLGAEIARGGMGRIVRARDHRLGRNLAIKELLSRQPALEQRFEREMRLTAHLQHPAIIAIHEAGRWPSGAAFYTMKRVEGKPLNQVVAETPQLHARLALLPTVLAVADAIAYAHGEGVVHRDLKPGNILVGEFGETVVIDWGLAKQLDDDAAEEALAPESTGGSDPLLTALGAAIGTPAYMPPQQASGEVVDERADVYALGAILYELLSGSMPYADRKPGDQHELLDMVKAGEPTPLAALNADIPPDLVTIAAKAMARDVTDRYPTAAELASDLRRYQSGQLVGAHEYSFAELIKRWVGRHRAAVGVAAVMVVLLVVGSALSFWRIARERDRAKRQQAVAEDNQREVEDMLSYMLVDLRNSLQPLGKVALLGMVARKASQYFAERPLDWRRPSAALERSKAHDNLGNVLRIEGDQTRALSEYRASQAIRARLLEIDPHDSSWQRALSVSHNKVGDVLREQGDLTGALAEYRAGQGIRARLLEVDPESSRALRDLTVSHDRIGNVLRASDDLAGALAEYRASESVRKRLLAIDPASSAAQRGVSVSHSKVGEVLRDQGDLAGALAEFRASKAIEQRMVELDPGNTEAQLDLCMSHEAVGDLLQAQGDLAGALAEYRAFAAIAQRLVALDAENSQWQRNLAMSHKKTADLLRAQGDLVRALAEARASHAIRKRLADMDPHNHQWQRDLAVGHAGIASLLAAQGELAGALREYRASKAVGERLAEINPRYPAWQEALAATDLEIARLLARLGDPEAGRAAAAGAAVRYESLARGKGDFYMAACAYAVGSDADKAFEMLDAAVAKGLADATQAEQDSDLESLRADRRWQPLLAKMRAIAVERQ